MRRFGSTVLVLGAFLALALARVPGTPALAQEAVPPPIVLGSPVDCVIPEVCWIQSYYDHDPGPAAEDYTCGRRTYDRHYGVDIRVANLKVMDRGIPVIAAADGVVSGVRDGMPDTGILEGDRDSVRGRECGNGVVVQHQNGWVTQYCHVRDGSVAVARGQQVKKGERLAVIGLSGLTEFPHVHFQVRNGRRNVDPFVGFEATGKCGTAAKPLFEDAFLDRTPYVETGLLNAGFTGDIPAGEAVLRGEHVNEKLPIDTPALIYWVELFGTQPGDRDDFQIVAPDGSTIVQQTRPAQQGHSARHLGYAGLRRPQQGWRPGEYRGIFRLLRDEAGQQKVAFTLERTVIVGTATTAPTATPEQTPATPSSPAPTSAAVPPPAQGAAPAGPSPSRETAPPGDQQVAATTTTQTNNGTQGAVQPPQRETAAGSVTDTAQAMVDRAADLLPPDLASRLPSFLQASPDSKGPPPWMVALGLLSVIFAMAAVAYITRR